MNRDALKEHELVALHQLEEQLIRFGKEARLVVEELVVPGWSGPLHGMSNVLYGCVMRCFSFIDLFSKYEAGGGRGSQTRRMIGFLVQRVGVAEQEADAAVRIWRHKLMHTAAPRPLLVRGTGQRIEWLLQWGPDHLPRNQHFRFHEHGDRRILAIGLEFLIEDVLRVFRLYRQDLEKDQTLRARFRDAQEEIKWGEIEGPVTK